jgi:hypothetical protein
MRTIRASEIGTFRFCQKAWSYQKQGIPSENSTELAAGTEVHEQHGRRVFRAQMLSMLGWVLLAGAVILLAVYLIQKVL